MKDVAKGMVSIRGFSWYLNISIIFWEQIATYFESIGALILCVLCIKNGWGPTGGNKLAIYNLIIIDHLKVLIYTA